MERSKDIVIALLAIVCALLVCLHLNDRNTQECVQEEPAQRVTRYTTIDTIRYYMPVRRDSVVPRYVTERLPVAHVTNEEGKDTVQFAHITNEAISTLIGEDSVDVHLPISVIKYQSDEYSAWVSGYRASLDSIFVYPRHEVVTITNTPKRKRWGVGINAGYGFTPHGAEPYIGIGIQYNLFSF